MAGDDSEGDEDDEFGNEEDEPWANYHEEEGADGGLRWRLGFERDPHADVWEGKEKADDGEEHHREHVEERPILIGRHGCAACSEGREHGLKNRNVEHGQV